MYLVSGVRLGRVDVELSRDIIARTEKMKILSRFQQQTNTIYLFMIQVLSLPLHISVVVSDFRYGIVL